MCVISSKESGKVSTSLFSCESNDKTLQEDIGLARRWMNEWSVPNQSIRTRPLPSPVSRYPYTVTGPLLINSGLSSPGGG